jgi:putative spermidine/putrescine transport system substrate-binding protein
MHMAWIHRQTSMSRSGVRVTLGLIGAAAALAFASGCGSSSSSEGTAAGGSSTTTAAQAVGSSLDGTTLSYLGFGGGIDDAIKQKLMDPFSQRTGAKFVLDQPMDYKKIETQVKSGNVTYDIIDGDPYVVDAQCGTTYEPLNVDLSQAQPEYRPQSKCGVPEVVYGIVIAYDKEKFPSGGPQTCADFFDTEKYPGKRALWSYYVSGIVECAAIAAGADPKDPYPIDVDAAFQKLDSIKDDVVFYDTTAQAVDGMENQDVAMGIYQARPVQIAVEAGAPFVPSTAWAARGHGLFAVPKGAPHKEAAEQWLNEIMQKKNQSEGIAPVYGSPLGGTMPADADALAKDLNPVLGTIAKNAMDIDWTWWIDNVGPVSQRFTDFATG